MPNKNKKNSSLEREVITAVTVLYLFIVGALLAIHYMQPLLAQPAAAPEKSASEKPAPAAQKEKPPAKKKASHAR